VIADDEITAPLQLSHIADHRHFDIKDYSYPRAGAGQANAADSKEATEEHGLKLCKEWIDKRRPTRLRIRTVLRAPIDSFSPAGGDIETSSPFVSRPLEDLASSLLFLFSSKLPHYMAPLGPEVNSQKCNLEDGLL